MRKLLLILAISILFVSPAFPVSWTVANQATVAWDAVTKTVEDVVIPAADLIEYEIYLVPSSSANKDADKILLGTTQELEYTITFPSEGRWLAGARTVRTPEGETDKQYSIIIWSDSDDAIVVPSPFGFMYFAAPGSPGGFGPK